MPYGKLTPEMEEAIRPWVEGKRVWDLGAGDLDYAIRLRDLGAEVTAVDKTPMPEVRDIETIEARFDEVSLLPLWVPYDTVFLSWPYNYEVDGLLRLVAKAPVVIYLGCNRESEGSSCGGPDIWTHFMGRTLLRLVEHKRNDLMVYGEDLSFALNNRELCREERNACEQWFPGMLDFIEKQEAEARRRSSSG